ncbi:MAG: hypothetical protein E6J41_09715 [Chloroflexi bacterium]|nr:MAG: hypothetical protein E6J41_09715 [Chloroflexota bacterium]
MTWLVWRQHRLQALCAALVLAGGIAALLSLGAAAHGLRLDGSASALTRLDGLRGRWFGLQAAMLQLPALAGIFLGAPLFARDLGRGTHRLILTQGATRRRWIVVSLAWVLVPVLLGGLLLGLVAALSVWDLDEDGVWGSFESVGVVAGGYLVLAVALGTAAGALIGRILPAMVVTWVAYGVVHPVVIGLRQAGYLLFGPLRVTTPGTFPISPLPAHDWIVGQTVGTDHIDWWYYPLDRFWTFQAVETAILLALTAALLGLTVVFLRRRLA